MTIARSPSLSPDQPFPGLRPYAFEDHDYFFGREDQVFSIFRLLDRNSFVAVVGASGSGKSSLVRAGLLPLLEAEAKGAGGRAWRRAEMRPGESPLGELADCLAELANDADPAMRSARRERIAFALRRSSFGLREALNEIEGLENASLVLLVDQFEELFRYARTGDPDVATEAQWREEAVHFVQLLLAAGRDQTHDVRVLITMRSDFIGDCGRFHGLPEAISATQFLVPSLTRDQTEEAIRGPIEKAGAGIEPALVERLINDCGDDLDELPVLQHCLLRLWEQAARAPDAGAGSAAASGQAGRPARHLRSEHYEAIGGIAHALSWHADEILRGLGGLELVVEQVFRAVSELDKERRATRRALPFAQLLAETGVPEAELRKVVDRFRADDCSFLTPSLTAVPVLSAESRVDVGHEALLRRWERVSADQPLSSSQESDLASMGGWLRAEDDDGRFYHGLRALAGSKTTLPLDQVEALWSRWTSRPRTKVWAERYGGEIGEVQRLFDRSLTALAAERQRREQAERAERDAAIARSRLQRRIIFSVSAGLMFALTLAGLAFWQWRIAVAESARAEAASARAQEESARAQAESERAQKALSTAYEMWTASERAFDEKLSWGLTIREAVGSTGDLTDLIETTRSRLDHMLSMSQADPQHKKDWQRRLSRGYRLLGDILGLSSMTSHSTDRYDAFDKCRAILEELVDPEDTGAQRNLSLCYDRMGDWLVADAREAEGEQTYRKGIEIDRKLAEGRANTQSLHDLAIGYGKIGNIQRAADKLEDALASFRAGLAAWKRLIELDRNRPDWQRELALVEASIGEVLAGLGRHADALASYQDALAIFGRVSRIDAKNAHLPHDQLSLLDNIGAAYRAQNDLAAAAATYRKALGIAQSMAKDNSGNVAMQFELAVRRGLIGWLLSQSNDSAAALREYQARLGIIENLSRADPKRWQVDLAVAKRQVGDVLVALGRLEEAIAAYRTALAIREAVVSADTGNVQAQLELVRAHWILAAHGDDPLRRFTLIVATLRKLKDDSRLTPDQAAWLPQAEDQLKKVTQ
jgi:tetratricopeptide (TPR) repeat protein